MTITTGDFIFEITTGWLFLRLPRLGETFLPFSKGGLGPVFSPWRNCDK